MELPFGNSDFQASIQPGPIAAPKIRFDTIVRFRHIGHRDPFVLIVPIPRAQCGLNRNDLLVFNMQEDIGLAGLPPCYGHPNVEIDNLSGAGKGQILRRCPDDGATACLLHRLNRRRHADTPE